MTDQEREYVERLRAKAEEVGSLEDLVSEIKRAAERRGVQVKGYSKGTWSRILKGDQVPGYRHKIEIALACGLDLPDPPPLVAAQEVTEWHRVGGGLPKYGLLLSKGGVVQVREGGEDQGLTVKVKQSQRSPTAKTRKRRSMIIRLEDITAPDNRRLGRGKSGDPEAIETAARRAAENLEGSNVTGDLGGLFV